MKQLIVYLSILFAPYFLRAQNTASIFGTVQSKESNEILSFVNVYLLGTQHACMSDYEGNFRLEALPEGTYTLQAHYIGRAVFETNIQLRKGEAYNLNILMVEQEIIFNPVVVTGTRTFKSKYDSPVIVNVIDQKSLDKIQACNLSEGLNFQPGLRVETDCQTCNYTQLRMNGLPGTYSQILINGRPIFSALSTLYGLEQIPTQMVDRIEVVKGGGSALYGSNAIGGTVNIITKIPTKNQLDVDYTYQNINTQVSDHTFNAQASFLNKKKNWGAHLFYAHRNRATYDHNRDNFSELPQLNNHSIGSSIIYKDEDKQKLEISLNYINEYRYGGEMQVENAHLSQQAEERQHHVFMGNIDYQVNFNKKKSSFIAYLGNQLTFKNHYTGILPDSTDALNEHLAFPPYGEASSFTLMGGLQFNHKFLKFLGGNMVLTSGLELNNDVIEDQIKAYNYNISQNSFLYSAYIQSDWEILPSLCLLSGARIDKSNFVDKFIINPRFSLMYSLKKYHQWRVSWGQGFRAPQALDTDLHLAFAGGGVSRITLSENLQEERSQSLTASYTFNYPKEKFILGFTLEGFYTHLKDVFYLHPLGEDAFGEVFEKRNGIGAQVFGGSIEFRANYQKKLQIEAGYTLQRSEFTEAQLVMENLAPQKPFLRTPNAYAYGVLSIMPSDKFYININSVYTGSMNVLHLAGAPEQAFDEIVTTQPFLVLSYKMAYTFSLHRLKSKLELSGGIKNITNAYQSNFDTGKFRDSNFVYGPAMPRTFFLGLKWRMD